MASQSNSIIEALFFKCYYAYLLGNFEDTTAYYALLKEEFLINGTSTVLNNRYLTELARVRSALCGGSVSLKSWLTEPVHDIERYSSNMSQKDLVKRIHFEGFEKLRTLLCATDSFFLYNIEHPCDQYGFVDMYYQDGLTAFPIEIKVGQGDHRLLGQILKYDLYCRLHLHEKFYMGVQAVTLCGSYDEYTLTELKRQGVISLTYKVNDGVLFLSKC